MTQLPRESSRGSSLTLRCQLQGVLKGSEHKQSSPLSFLLQGMMREETQETADQYLTLSLVSLAEFMEEF